MSLFFSWFALANLWLTFSIIIDLLPSQGIVFGNIVAVCLSLSLLYVCTHLFFHRFIGSMRHLNGHTYASWLYRYVHWNKLVGWDLIFDAQFILALGNRPKSERVAYTATMWVYAVLAVYLLVCSLWLTSLSFVVSPSIKENKFRRC